MKKILVFILLLVILPAVSAFAQTSDRMDNYYSGRGAGASLDVDDSAERAATNTLVGVGAGALISTGDANSVYGYGAGRSLTTGYGNALFGMLAGANLTTENNKLYINNGWYPTYGIFGDFSRGYFGIDNTGTAGVALTVTGMIVSDSLTVDVLTGAASRLSVLSSDASSTLNADSSGVVVLANSLSAKRTRKLPTGGTQVAGLQYEYIAADADSLLVSIDQTGTLYDPSDSICIAEGTPSGFIVRGYNTLASMAGTLRLVSADTNKWYVMSYTGTWTRY